MKKLPSLFLGHGSPINAIANNAYTQALSKLPQLLSAPPQGILVISAHWLTDKTYLQSSLHPKTIHDFGGFPKALFEIDYPAPGIPQLAQRLMEQKLGETTKSWGLDHGSWSVLRHIYPKADIPVLQMSLNRNFTYQEHFDLAQKLSSLREEGILILASGNIVHNLREIEWDENAESSEWAIEFDQLIWKLILTKDHQGLLKLKKEQSALFNKAHPTDEHFLPLIYAIGASCLSDSITTIFEGMQNASISMRSFMLIKK
jgi:4,5-DOPA dioxygenase extradiol